MKITKLEHSGVAIEKNGQVLVFDPVEFTRKLPKFTGVVGVVITHEHNDHCQPEKIARILAENPGARVMTTEDNAESLERKLSEIRIGEASRQGKPEDVTRVEVMRPGENARIGDFGLKFFGGEHATIIPGVVPCQNVGVVVDDMVVNPGDSFDVTGVETRGKVLLAPIAAPWCKVSEVADFVREARPGVVIPVHDAVLSALGLGFTCAHIASVCQQIGAEFRELEPGESLTID